MREVDHVLLQRVGRMLAPLRMVLDPVFLGMERIPDERPLLFVGNHTIYGVLDVPFLFHELYAQKGIALRGLGDHVHFRIPIWRELLLRAGAVDGTRENCEALMRAGESVLVFPGGGREVAKRRNERYKLVWKERMGFVRLAIANGCTIVPFASVGVDDALDVVLDADDIAKTPVGALLRRFGVRHDVILPLARGVGPTPLPRPERLYFAFGDAIPTVGHPGGGDDDALRALRDRVRQAVEDNIAMLLDFRNRDPKRGFVPRVAAAADALFRRQP